MLERTRRPQAKVASLLGPVWSTEAGVFLGIWLALMFFGRSMLFRDPGTFWHVTFGERMLQTGRVMDADPVSFTRYGQPWVAHQWLGECVMAAIHRVSGWDGLLLASATLLAAVYTWIAFRLLRAGLHWLPTVLVVVLVLLASSHNFHIRPLLVSIALLAWTFALLVEVEAGRKHLVRLCWLVPVFALWANTHAGVLAGFGTVGFVIAGWCLAWVLGRESPVRNWPNAMMLGGLILACGLSFLVNPYGLGLPRAWLSTLALPLPELIQEHAPLDLSKPVGWTILLLGLGYVVLLAGVLPKWPRATWWLPLIWFFLASQRIRNAPLFAITAAIACADLLPCTRWAKWLADRDMFRFTGRDEPVAPGGGKLRTAAVPLVVVGVAVLLQVAQVPVPIVGHGWAKFDSARWPVELLPELRDIDRHSPAGTRVFNDLNYGGFLIYHAPRLRVFIDDRCALYGGDLLNDYDHARRNDPSQVDRWYEQYRFPYALVETGSPLDRHLAGAAEWVIVRRTTPATLYRRKPVMEPRTTR